MFPGPVEFGGMEGIVPGVGLVLEAMVGVADDGRDQPGPGLSDWGAPVSLVVTSRGCEVVVVITGRAV